MDRERLQDRALTREDLPGVLVGVTLLLLFLVGVIVAPWVTAAVAAVGTTGFRISEEGQRIAIFRSGRFSEIKPLGLSWVVPFFDQIVRIDLNEAVPNWRALESDQIREAAESWARQANPIS